MDELESASVDIEEEAMITMNQSDISELKHALEEVRIKLRESVSQRAILESVISERLDSERTATMKAKELKAALLRVSSKCSELIKEKEIKEAEYEQERSIAKHRESRLRFLEEKLLEVETFLLSDQGEHIIQLESELAETKLAVAELESEKDELEQQLNEYYLESNEEEEYGEEECSNEDGSNSTLVEYGGTDTSTVMVNGNTSSKDHMILYQNQLSGDNKFQVDKELKQIVDLGAPHRKPLGQWNGGV